MGPRVSDNVTGSQALARDLISPRTMGEHRNGVTGGPELSAIDSPDNTRTDDEDLHFRRRTFAGSPGVAIAFRRPGARRGRCVYAAVSALRRIVVADGASVAAGRRSSWVTVR